MYTHIYIYIYIYMYSLMHTQIGQFNEWLRNANIEKEKIYTENDAARMLCIASFGLDLGTHVDIYIHIYIYIYINICIHIYICKYTYTRRHKYCIFLCPHMYVCELIYVYIHMYLYDLGALKYLLYDIGVPPNGVVVEVCIYEYAYKLIYIFFYV
jgi:hypothetical protein